MTIVEENAASAEHSNSVAIVGRVSAPPEERELPSGDRIVTVRLVVSRPEGGAARTSRRRQSVDVVDCVAWSSRCRRSVASWRTGDLVALEGALRRRFFRTGNGTQSRVEVEVTRGRLIRRASA